jgi:hypothetical protein
MVTVTTSSVVFSKPELETTYVFHNESVTQMVFLGGMITEEA